MPDTTSSTAARAKSAHTPRPRSPPRVAQIQLSPDVDGEAAGDESGYSVSLSANGTCMVVGARYNGGTGVSAGHTHVFALVGAAVPVTLAAFNAAYDPSTDAAVTWRMAAELDNVYFVLEHVRGEATGFASLVTLSGRGTTDSAADYAHAHAAPGTGTHYYRLRRVDYDGAETASEIVAVEVGASAGNTVAVYPTPPRTWSSSPCPGRWRR